GAFNGDVQVWDIKTGETKRVLAGTGAPRYAVGFSADGQRIAWGNANRCPGMVDCPNGLGPLSFKLVLPRPGKNLGSPQQIDEHEGLKFVRHSATYGPHALAHRKGASGYQSILDLTKDGQLLASIERGSTDGFAHRDYSFTTDGQTIISGGNGGYL